MVESPAISALESAAADLGKLLSGWTRDRLAEAESAHANPADPAAKRPDLVTINAGIQSLWRLVSVQKSILQLKTPPSAPEPSPNRPLSEFRFGVQTSVCPKPVPNLATQPAPSAQPAVARASARDNQPDPSPPHADSVHRQSAVPLVPCVPSVPSLPAPLSIEAITARIEKLHAQTAALISATMPIPEPGNADLPIGKTQSTNVPPPSTHQPAPALPDKLKSKLLDVITSRPTFPGSGNLLDSLRADLLTSPP